jgi:hypothetical protein
VKLGTSAGGDDTPAIVGSTIDSLVDAAVVLADVSGDAPVLDGEDGSAAAIGSAAGSPVGTAAVLTEVSGDPIVVELVTEGPIDGSVGVGN